MRQLIIIAILGLSGLLVNAQSSGTAQPSLRFIRNATLTLNYAGHKILVDPLLLPKGSMGSIWGKAKSPMVELPIPVEEIIHDVDLVLVTHNHPDHFDTVASSVLNKSIKLINQPKDKDFFNKQGFVNAESLEESLIWKGITITRTNAQHGTGEILLRMGNGSGYVLQALNQPTIYIVGDAVWTEDINQNIKRFQPDYVIVNSGGAVFPKFPATPILMDADETMALIQESGEAKVIAVHMDAIDHCLTTRDILKAKAKDFKIDSQKLLIPDDGETLELQFNR
ncbi:MAG: MBL fold metallo-hydrolase [Chitinophagaceae bacterium]|nr:MBL fold metallo-hydrolase [Chitinophagaceae bacterium]MCW5928204.1 MBL fold metallo-hydrolase [Chitinophagaceae bacterium]